MKNKTRVLPVKWKLFSYFLLFTAALIALLWISQTVLLEKIYSTNMMNTIKSQSEVIADNIDNDQLKGLLEGVSRNHSLSAQLIQKDGSVIYSAQRAPGSGLEMASPFEKKYWHLAEENGGQYIVEGTVSGLFDQSGEKIEYNEQNFHGDVPKNDQFKASNITCATIIQRADGSEVMLLMSAFLQPVGSIVGTLQLILTGVSVVMVALSMALALLLSHRIAAPIASLSLSARELADGNYGTAFSYGGYSEINELADTLNYAAGELSKVENLRREFIANVSHDLRTPLTMICGYAEMMRDIPGENSPENVQIIIDEASRLSGMVTNILDLSKIQSGASEPETAEFDLTACIRGLVARFAKFSGRNDIEFQSGRSAAVLADEGMITRAVYNLLSNADAHTPPGGRISVCQSVTGDAVRITVTDNGNGIPPEELDHIWERYAKGSGGDKAGGTGLGLAIVRAIVLAHHGGYGVSSSPGNGSSFWISLPIYDGALPEHCQTTESSAQPL